MEISYLGMVRKQWVEHARIKDGRHAIDSEFNGLNAGKDIQIRI